MRRRSGRLKLKVTGPELGDLAHQAAAGRRRARSGRRSADGYLDDTQRRPTTGWTALDRFLQCDASDVGCDEAMVLLPFTSSWWPVMPRRSSATPASRRTFGRAVRVGRISTGC